jgi:phenol hydroxylase P3 protein
MSQDSSALGGTDIKGATADRLYEQYALTTKDLTWDPSYVTKEELAESEFTTGVHFRDWDTFEDPFRLHYADYVRVQSDKESIMAEQKKLAARFKEVDGIDLHWLQAMKLFYPAATNSEAEAHRGHAALARFSPSPALSMAAFYQVLDEIRHAQMDTAAMRFMRTHTNSFENWALMYQHQWVLQTFRSLFEDMLMVEDPFEMAINTNLTLELGYSNMLFVATPGAAVANGDRLYGQHAMSTQSDETRHAALGQAVIRTLLEEDERNVPIVQRWLDKWTWRHHRVFGVNGIFLDYFAKNKTLSHKQAVNKYFLEGYIEGMLADYGPLGLKPPMFLDDIIAERDTHSHIVYKLAHQYKYINYFCTFAPDDEDKAWLREEYPEWDSLVGKYWDSVDAGDSGDVMGLPLICNLCHFPCIFPNPDNPQFLRHEHRGRTYWFCSRGCKWIFEQEPHKYQDDYTLVELIFAGKAPSMIDIAELMQFMGLRPDGSSGGDLYLSEEWKAWKGNRGRVPTGH